MKNLLLAFAFLFSLSTSVISQSYDISVSNEPYIDLEGSTSLNNGDVWDDPEYSFDIGFTFQLLDKETDQLNITGLGAWLYGDSFLDSEGLTVFLPNNVDLIDRGYYIDSSLSDISYLVEGEAGSKILKMQWQNAGFYSDLEDNMISTDYTNFQVWLYESSNKIEVRFGPTSITQPDLAFDFETGTLIAFIHELDLDTDEFSPNSRFLSGDPLSPTFSTTLGYINGNIPEGTIYTFSPIISNTLIEGLLDELEIYPNPASDEIVILNINPEEKINKINIYNSLGQKVESINYQSNRIDISNLTSGLYSIELLGLTSKITKNVIKI